MPVYRFAIRNCVTENAELGFLAMPDDGEASNFAADVLRDLTLDPAPQYAGAVLEIKEGRRLVEKIPFKAEKRNG